MLLDNLMEAKLLGIIGDGNMGWQIATLSALRGYKVFIIGRKEKKNAFTEGTRFGPKKRINSTKL